MATVLIHLIVKVPNAVAEQDEKQAVVTAVEAVRTAVYADLSRVDNPNLEALIAMAEVVDYDE